MTALALHSTRNTGGKSDATGAFVPEAVHFSRHYACHREGFDNTLGAPQRRASVEATIRKHRDLDMVAIFGHGLRRSLQTGHDMATVDNLAAAIADATGPNVAVVLYACSTGGSENGFASALRNALHARGKTGHVDAHTQAGHCCRLPYVRRFIIGETDSDWVVVPGSPEWARWRTGLTRDLRFRFPAMTIEQIRAELR
jgi:hypothetical protein